MAKLILERPETLAISAMPVLNEADTVLAAFQQMATANIGACVVKTGENQRWLMKSEWLKKAYFEQKKNLNMDIAQVELGTVIAAAAGASHEMLLPSPHAPSGGAFHLLGDGSQRQEWGLQFQEGGLQLLSTQINLKNFRAPPPPVFYCKNGHENPTPIGHCSWCPEEIIS